MRQQKCKLCGKLRLFQNAEKNWICSACGQRVEKMLQEPQEQPRRSCPKCKVLKRNECPFTEKERKKIIICNHFEHKDAEHNKKRWEKYGF